jgi:nucleoid DNA-binding protein
MAKVAKASGKKPLSKSQVIGNISDETGLAKKEVSAVMEALTGQIRKSISKNGPGVFNLAGLMKVKRHNKPATKEREGINPATGEKIMIKAKPARTVVKVLALKALKEMV